jgi:protein-tyrosine phosphatase
MASICDATIAHPCIVRKTESIQPIKYWRTARMLYNASAKRNFGLKNLWISASDAPSYDDFILIKNNISKITKNTHRAIMVIDLREETHAYLNNIPITLMTEYDWINVGKSRQEILTLENKWIGRLFEKTCISNVLTSIQFKEKEFSKGIKLPVHTVKSEENIVKSFGLKYFRLPVTDHRAPNNSEVDRFFLLVKYLPSDTWLHLHCSGGKGRTTTFFAMYDMLKNANKISFIDIIKRQASVSPFYDLSTIVRNHPQFQQYYVQRLLFLKNFYLFSQDYLSGYSGTWSDWVTNQSLKKDVDFERM